MIDVLILLLPLLGLAAIVWLVHGVGNEIRWLLRSRPCPRCGLRVAKGEYVCEHCGHTF